VLGLVRLDDFAARLPQQLSGGQQQRVALARALAPQPEVLLLDEPLSALDLKLRKEMQSELKRLQTETGITFVFVTHDQEEALTMSDRIGVMSSGKLLQVGTPHDIYERPVNRFVADFIGETNFVEATLAQDGARLASGDRIAVSASKSGAVTLAVRPEHIRIVAADQTGAFKAKVTDKTYFGTDTHYQLTLGDGTTLVARLQSGAGNSFDKGADVGVDIDAATVQVLDA
jgi:spermidine/putrescine transport system ATP-binding protein